MSSKKVKLALRTNSDNENHHLWNNRGVWWCHITVHGPHNTSERVRFSLRTKRLERARVLRDKIFSSIKQHFDIV